MAKGNPKRKKELKGAWETYARRRRKLREEYEARVREINERYKIGVPR